MDSNKLKQIIKDDDLGLLDIKAKNEDVTPDERLANSFLEIVEFFKKHNRTPEPSSKDVNEYRLYSRLRSINNDAKKIKILQDLDEYNLLKDAVTAKNITDIMKDDDLDILSDDTGIFTLKNVPKKTDLPDYIGRQKPSKDFIKFEHIFVSCQEDLGNRKKVLRSLTSEQQIQQGQFYILRGILVYVAEIGEIKEVSKKQKNRGNINARLRLIYENGTESDILLRSLARAIYQDGYRVVDAKDKLLENFEEIAKDDSESGYIYILKSLSENPEISKISNLYKIGFSTKPIKDRIKNAEKDPTFLMAPVKIVASFRCYNMNTQKFEHLLHKFFGKVKLDTEIINKNKIDHSAGEWFVVPIDIITQVVQLIINGEIVHYFYDTDLEELKLIEKLR